MRRHVSALWQRTPDIYGLGFTVIMAGARAGDRRVDASSCTSRTSSSRSAAVGAMLWLLWKRTRNPAVLAFVGLHPLLAVSVVNGGHPDALVALGVLAGRAARDRPPAGRGRRRVRVRGVGQLHRARRRPAVLCVWAFRRWTRPRGREVRGDRRRVRRAAVPVHVGLAAERARALRAHQPAVGLERDRQLRRRTPTCCARSRRTARRSSPARCCVVIAVRHTSRGTPELAIAAGLAVVPRRELVGDAVVRVHRAPAARAAPAEPAELDGRALLVAGAARRAVPVAVGDRRSARSGTCSCRTCCRSPRWSCCVIVIVFRPRDVLAGELDETAVDATVTAEPRLAASA